MDLRNSPNVAQAASMRPSDITDGNNERASVDSVHGASSQCFNEAVGYYRRKHPTRRASSLTVRKRIRLQ